MEDPSLCFTSSLLSPHLLLTSPVASQLGCCFASRLSPLPSEAKWIVRADPECIFYPVHLKTILFHQVPRTRDPVHPVGRGPGKRRTGASIFTVLAGRGRECKRRRVWKGLLSRVMFGSSFSKGCLAFDPDPPCVVGILGSKFVIIYFLLIPPTKIKTNA